MLLFGSSIGPQSSGGTISLTAGNILRIFLRRVESLENSTEELQDWEKSVKFNSLILYYMELDGVGPVDTSRVRSDSKILSFSPNSE